MKNAISHIFKNDDALANNNKPRRTPWWCNHYNDTSDIVAAGETDANPVVIAKTFNTPKASAAFHAELIVSAVNNQEQMKEIINGMICALELCLQSGGLTWAAEQEAEFVSNKARQII